MWRPLSLFACLLISLVGCASTEPLDGCVLAAANRREVLRAEHFRHPAIEARIVGMHLSGRSTVGHAALIYRLDGGWWAYDDTFGSRPLHLSAVTFPDPVIAARAAFRGVGVRDARWLDPER